MVKTAGLQLVPIKSYSKNNHPSFNLKWTLEDSRDLRKRQIEKKTKKNIFFCVDELYKVTNVA